MTRFAGTTVAIRRAGRPLGFALAATGLFVAAMAVPLSQRVEAQAPAPIPITSCDAATVLADMQAGGSYAFQCDGTIGLTAGITLTNSLSLDATGHTVTLSYDNPNVGAVAEQRLVEVEGGSLTLTNLTISGWSLGSLGGAGFEQGANGTNGIDGTDATDPDGAGGDGTPGTAGAAGLPGKDATTIEQGGALKIDSGTVVLTNDTFTGNSINGDRGGPGGFGGNGGTGGSGGAGGTFGTGGNGADGGAGGAGANGGSGGLAEGGAIYNAGTLTVSGTTFVSNSANGGPGGVSGFGGIGGSGGSGGNVGGADSATGGNGGDAAPGGPSGAAGAAADGLGGAIYNAGTLHLSGTTFSNNQATGGFGGLVDGAGAGGNGGVAGGCASGCSAGLSGDGASGGAGGRGGNGGNAAGAGLYDTGTSTFAGVKFLTNSAVAGDGGNGATGGFGGGGGVGGNTFAPGGTGGNGGNGGNAQGGAEAGNSESGSTAGCSGNTVVAGAAGDGGASVVGSGSAGTNGTPGAGTDPQATFCTGLNNNDPTSAFTISPNTKVPGQYQFVSDSTDPQGEALTQDWTLGDGTTAVGPAVTHTYLKPGTFPVTLTVTNTSGLKNASTQDVVVAAPTLSSSLAFVDSSGNVLSTVSPQVGDTVNVRLTIAASDDGVGPVNSIGFTGDPLTLTPNNLTTVTGPTPAIPTGLSLQPGDSQAYRYALKVVAAGVVKMTSTPVGVDVTGAAVKTQPAQLSFGISSLKVTVSLNPSSFTETQTATGTTPTDVTATVTITNISPDPVTEINLRSIAAVRTSVGQLLAVTYKSGVDPDPTLGYPLDGITLDSGDSTLPLKTVFAVTSDGKINFQALATAAANTGATLRGFGVAQLTVTPTKYLEFTSQVTTPGSGLLAAGSPIVISGTVHNLTSSDTLDVGPLFAKLAGNAGLQGLAYNGVGVDPKSLTVPGALTLDPGDTKTFTLKVLTSYSDPAGAGGVLPSGGTNAEVTFTPWATVTQPDGTSFTTDPDGSQILTTDDDLTHRISIDDSIPIPQVSAAVVAGGLLYGGAEGVWNAASGLVTGLINLPNVAASGLLAVTNYQATVWNSFTEAQKQQFADSTTSMIAAVLEANEGLAAEGVAQLYNKASAFTLQYFTMMENEWQVGNYAQTVETYASLSSNALAQVAIPVGLGKLASSTEALSAVDEAQAALQSKLADLAENIDSAETMEQVAPLLTEISNGTELDPDEVSQLFGITPDELAQLQKLATEFRYLLTVRSRAASSIDWLEKFQALVKPEAIKIKTVSELDARLGYPESTVGSLVFKEPVPLIELRKSGGQISDLVQAYVEQQGFEPGSPDYYNAINRVALRISEWNKWEKTYMAWNKQGWIDVSFNWKGNAMADPEVVGRGKYVGFRMQPTGVEGEYVMEMFNGKAGKFVPITGDIDPIAFTHLDGSPLTAAEHASLLDAMRTNPLLQTQHGESATYVNGGIDFIESQFKPNEAALQIAPDDVAPRIVRFDTNQSIWNSATDYQLVWDGGVDYAGSSPPYDGEPLEINYQQLAAPETPAPAGTPLPLPGAGAGAPNVGRCYMTYSSSSASLPLIMGANGTLQQVTASGDVPSNLENICFSAGPEVDVSIRPSTDSTQSVQQSVREIPVESDPSVAGPDPNTGFAVGQQVTVGAGSSDAESGIISGFGSIILSSGLKHDHPAGDVIVETAPAPTTSPGATTSTTTSPAASATTTTATSTTSTQPLARTGFDLAGLLALAFSLLIAGATLIATGTRRRRPS